MGIGFIQEKYMDNIAKNYYNYYDTKRISQYEAIKKIISILEEWSESDNFIVDGDSYPRYIRKLKSRDCLIRINEFINFTFKEFKITTNDAFTRADSEWSAEISCWRSEDDRLSYYKKPKARFNISFNHFLCEEIRIDGIIYTKNIKPSDQAELIILTSQSI